MYSKFDQLLKESGKTIYRVSKDTGINTATLYNWKKGLYKPKADKLVILADYFGVTVDVFISRKESGTTLS